MREIKFRAWDGNKMTYADMASLVRPNGLDFRLAVHNEAVIMQFTGLKDKNGVEIWEGDVYEFFGYTVEDGLQKRRLIREVVKPGDIESLWRVYCLMSMNNLEVLGNVWEHPHLLKES